MMQEEGVAAGVGILRQREKFAAVTIYATFAFVGLGAIGEMLELGGVIDLVDAPDAPLAVVYQAVMLANLAVFIASVIAISMWIYRAHANLHEAGLPALKFSPGWAVGWYFIPIANLFKPFQAMRELWTDSHQTSDSFSADPPGNLGAWWGLWIVGNILGNISTRLSLLGDGTTIQLAIALGLASSFCTLFSAWLLLGIIRQITAAQTDGLEAAQIFE
ncbi:DUF4328 domain-containing protein [Porphyrobacter sp. AAP82]|uniref:DUF4328 domain-containing protein n=1 Tax=Porphyrobacter sp. AAP82 TaxID=1248917 RepID=UPI000370D97F|nr:DUF4328 domain-containing protein [Porphyrobacter sp. AAP82]